MGNGPSYAKIAVTQWYLEGVKYYGKAGYEHARKHVPAFQEDITSLSMRDKIVLVTGANQGIGYEAARALALMGAEVHLLCRNATRGAEAADRINANLAAGATMAVSHTLDVGEFHEVRAFAATWVASGKHVDILINNAGCMPHTLTKTSEGNEAISACTIGGTLLLTGLLLPVTSVGGRVINVSSGGQYSTCCRPFDLNYDNVSPSSYDGTLFYAVAKKHQVMLTETMAEKFGQSTRVSFFSMHPGWCDTEAIRTAMPDFHKKQKSTLRSPAEGADTIVYLAASSDSTVVANEANGTFWFDRQVVRKNLPFAGTKPSAQNYRDLWNAALDLVGGNIIALGAGPK
jgi:dehydrogenase/reductase SDR family member 12